MAIAYVAGVSSGTNSGGTTSAGVDTTGADLLVMVVCYFSGAAAPTVSDSKGNTWTALTAVQSTGGGANNKTQIYYAKNPTVGSGHTFTASGASSFASLTAAAYSGCDTAAPFDQQNGTADSTQPGSVTPTQDNELVVTGLGGDVATYTSVNGGFTLRNSVGVSAGNYFGTGLADLVQTTAAAANPTWTVNSVTNSGNVIATFKAAAAATGQPAARRFGGVGSAAFRCGSEGVRAW